MDKNWPFRDTALGFALAWLLFALGDAAGARLGLTGPPGFYLGILLWGTALLAYLLLYLNHHHSLGFKIEIQGKNTGMNLLIGILAGLILGLLGGLNLLLQEPGILAIFQSGYILENFLPQGIFQKLLFLILFAGFLPVVEELYFRGFVYPSLNRKGSIVLAALTSATFSAVMLAGTVSFIYLFLAGLAFSLLYEREGSAESPIAAHVAMNLVLTLIIFIKGGQQ